MSNEDPFSRISSGKNPIPYMRIGNRREVIEAKLAEYKDRLPKKEFRSEDTQRNLKYRIGLAEMLLQNEQIDTSIAHNKGGTGLEGK